MVSCETEVIKEEGQRTFEVGVKCSPSFLLFFRIGALHLTPVESIIQLRPSMHYLDEIDRLNKEAGRRGGAGKAGGEELSDVEMSGGDQSAGESKDAKPKGKAMSKHATVKVGEAGKGGPGDRDHLMRAQRLADGEPWVELEWAGEVVSPS